MSAAAQQRRFRTAAAHYLAGRSPYADRLIRRVIERVGLGPAHRVMDLGCGPAQLARAFAPAVSEVLAVDPEPEMLHIARDASQGIANITFHQASSADLSPDLGRFRLVCMGRSFHWMDRPDTLRRLDSLLEPGGAVALFHDTHPDVPDNAWWPDFRALLRRYAGEDGAGSPTRRAGWIRHEVILMQSAFAQVEEIGVYERRPITTETLIDRALSMSSTSRARLGDRTETMLEEIRTTFPNPGHELLASEAMLAFRE